MPCKIGGENQKNRVNNLVGVNTNGRNKEWKKS